MKIIFLILFSSFLSTCLIAQEETLFGDLNHSGGYGGPVWKIGQIGDNSGMLSGGRGGWIINHTFAIGGGGYNSIIDIETGSQSNDGENLKMKLNYGGFEFEYIRHSDRVMHWTFHTLIGGGQARLIEDVSDEEIEKTKFFVFEPSVNMDFNINRWFRIGIGASYRTVFGVDSDLISNSDLSGLSGLIVLKFGSF